MSAVESAFEHAVQFYEKDEFLCGRVADYFAGGLEKNEPGIMIATEEHCQAVAGHLRALGYDLRSVTFLDARETLSAFMSGNKPDELRFRETIGGAIRQRTNGGGRLRAYGEMVDLLWRDGIPSAAIQLEQLWNDLAPHFDFSLMCAYPIGNFYRETDTEHFGEICRQHSMVISTEMFTGMDDDTRSREITFLQQRAAALETEMARRKQLEEANAFLSEASGVLNRSLDYVAKIREIENVIVPRLADACTIDVARDEEEARPVISSLAGDRTRMVAAMRLPDREVGSITFISHTPRYNDEDLVLASELARRCAIALENARLFQLAQQANRAKDEFLATLSHELRTPLTAILGWARMLNLGSLDEDTKRIAYDTIERSARMQATLIDDLLDLSRIVTGKLSLQNELVDLPAIIDNAVQTQLLAAESKGIAIRVNTPSQGVAVNGDPTRLQQIVWNLVSNAIKFSDAGTSVSIEVERDDDQVRILVRDEGKGIEPEFLPHVFEAFRQADGASTRKHGGLGLGLAIVKYIAELHGGTVTAASDGKAQGATFIVTLPLASVTATRADVRIPSGSPGLESRP
jgi:signal transduction histidine kinase